MILVTLSLVTVEKVESTGGGESGEMCCDFREVGKVERIFSIFFCEELHKSVSQEPRGIYQW